jgi:protein-tyrosine phosphatase
MIDIHSHILPGLDDGARSWEESLQMARMAVADGIRVMVATPHLFKHKHYDPQEINGKNIIKEKIAQLKERLLAEGMDLEILPGCDFPLSFEALQLLDDGVALTINDSNRYLLLELPESSLPPALEEICFRLQSKGITPIITHPERHFIIQEMPQKLKRLIDLGCLAQLTGSSLTGGFGGHIKKVARRMIKKGYIHILASDSHDKLHRPPLLKEAVRELSRLIGENYARAMVTTIPDRIIKGEPCYS